MNKIGFNTLVWSAEVSDKLFPILDKLKAIGYDGVESLIGTVASAFIIGQLQSWFEYGLSGSMARASILLLVIVVLYFRPNGLFAAKVRR